MLQSTVAESQDLNHPMSRDKPRDNTSASGNDAYERLLDEIRLGQIRPGDRLTETDIATRFGLSRTPVREAIQQLDNDGLLQHTPRSGTTLRQLETADISELYEMRAVLESTAARFAARAASTVELDELQALHETMQASRDAKTLYALNLQFHQGLRDAARNRYLLRAARAIDKTLLILGPSTLAEATRPEAADEEHEAILQALCNREPEQAESAMRRHIESAHRARLRQLRQNAAEELK